MSKALATVKTESDRAKGRVTPAADPSAQHPQAVTASIPASVTPLGSTPVVDAVERYRATLQRLPSAGLRQQFVLALAHQHGNAYVQRVLAPSPARPSVSRTIGDTGPDHPAAWPVAETRTFTERYNLSATIRTPLAERDADGPNEDGKPTSTTADGKVTAAVGPDLAEGETAELPVFVSSYPGDGDADSISASLSYSPR